MAARWWAVLVLVFAPLATALAQDDTAPPAGGAELATIVVTGEQPGPGLWKVTKGDHVLWVLGMLDPLPRKMQWRADEVGEHIAAAQVLLARPSLEVGSDIGLFGQLALLPSLVGVRNNPDDKRLAEVVPADLYARWEPLKRRYLGRGNKVERWRPMFAAMELYRAAVRKNGMTVGSDAVDQQLRQLAKQAHLEWTPVAVKITIKEPRAVIKDFKKSELDDIECFAATIDRLETDLETMKQRANAWASGDLEALRALPYVDQSRACFAAMQRVQVLHDAGDITARARELWLAEVDKALAAHATGFAVLPMETIVSADGYLQALRARGYRVSAPDEQDSDAAPEAGAVAPAAAVD